MTNLLAKTWIELDREAYDRAAERMQEIGYKMESWISSPTTFEGWIETDDGQRLETTILVRDLGELNWHPRNEDPRF